MKITFRQVVAGEGSWRDDFTTVEALEEATWDAATRGIPNASRDRLLCDMRTSMLAFRAETIKAIKAGCPVPSEYVLKYKPLACKWVIKVLPERDTLSEQS